MLIHIYQISVFIHQQFHYIFGKDNCYFIFYLVKSNLAQWPTFNNLTSEKLTSSLTAGCIEVVFTIWTMFTWRVMQFQPNSSLFKTVARELARKILQNFSQETVGNKYHYV